MKYITVVLCGVLVYLTLSYLDRPTVEISLDSGNCIRAYDAHGDVPCDVAMKKPHEVLSVPK